MRETDAKRGKAQLVYNAGNHGNDAKRRKLNLRTVDLAKDVKLVKT